MHLRCDNQYAVQFRLIGHQGLTAFVYSGNTVGRSDPLSHLDIYVSNGNRLNAANLQQARQVRHLRHATRTDQTDLQSHFVPPLAQGTWANNASRYFMLWTARSGSCSQYSGRNTSTVT